MTTQMISWPSSHATILHLAPSLVSPTATQKVLVTLTTELWGRSGRLQIRSSMQGVLLSAVQVRAWVACLVGCGGVALLDVNPPAHDAAHQAASSCPCRTAVAASVRWGTHWLAVVDLQCPCCLNVYACQQAHAATRASVGWDVQTPLFLGSMYW